MNERPLSPHAASPDPPPPLVRWAHGREAAPGAQGPVQEQAQDAAHGRGAEDGRGLETGWVPSPGADREIPSRLQVARLAKGTDRVRSKEARAKPRFAYGAVAGVVLVAAAMVIVALAKPAQQVARHRQRREGRRARAERPRVGPGRGRSRQGCHAASSTPGEHASPRGRRASPRSSTWVPSTAPTAPRSAGPWSSRSAGSGISRIWEARPPRRATSSRTPRPSRSTVQRIRATPLSFSSAETQSDQGTPLEQPTTLQQALIGRYDRPPYTTPDNAGAIPFLMIGNKFVSIGASYSPIRLWPGRAGTRSPRRLSDPSSDVAQSVDGAANTLTAADLPRDRTVHLPPCAPRPG